MTWLLDVVPPDYRLHGILRRHPLALAVLARHHLAACVQGAREGYRAARTELASLPPGGVDAVLEVYRAEGRRLVETAHAVDLVTRALRGEVFTPRLGTSRPRTSQRGTSWRDAPARAGSQPGKARAGAPPPDTPQPGGGQPGGSQPGGGQAGRGEPGGAQPGGGQAGRGEPGGGQPGRTKPDATKPDATKPDATKPGARDRRAAKTGRSR